MVFVGALMIGIGLGVLFNNVAVGTMIGLGAGFILFGVIKAVIPQ